MLLIHGGLGSADDLGFQIPALADKHKVIVADSRGHGRSTRSDQPYSYALMADDYVALLDHLKIDKTALVGWSDGAIIGLDIAMRHPERLSRLFAFGANYTAEGWNASAADDPVFKAAIARTGRGLRPPVTHARRVRRLQGADLRDVGDPAELHQGPAARDHACRR